ncbi:MAG: hypothetical protein K5872_18375 [Rhizobiaceae bacterium]|nr:hypothetical protein [Rhizobiaceae bacterium]MCV0408192.1 hypothetical protein [Rhizobiaceae bacterium]
MTNIAQVSLRALVRDILPFLYAMLALLALITFFPDLVLFLPGLLGYQGRHEGDDRPDLRTRRPGRAFFNGGWTSPRGEASLARARLRASLNGGEHGNECPLYRY